MAGWFVRWVKINCKAMGFLKDIFSGGANTLVDSVGKVLDNVITTKEERLQLDNELVKAEMQYELDLKKLNNEEKQMVIGDIANARNREIQVQQTEGSTKLNKNLMPILAIGTIVLVFSLFYVLIFSPGVIKGDGRDIVMYLLGILSAVLTQIYSYYFGSSAGSADKQRQLNSINKNQ